jgi:hypothetical protein
MRVKVSIMSVQEGRMRERRKDWWYLHNVHVEQLPEGPCEHMARAEVQIVPLGRLYRDDLKACDDH